MSEEEKSRIVNAEEGKLIFNTTTGCLNYFHNRKWREFCENQDKNGTSVQFDENTGMLKYRVGEQILTFSMVQGGAETVEQQAGEAAAVPGESTSDLPVDCRRKPTRPYAGRDLVTFDMTELEANKPVHGIGFWRIIKGSGGHFVDSTVPNSQFSGIQGTTYHLRWTIATQCDTLWDEALVRIRPPCQPEPSESFAGSDQFNVTEARLNANHPRSGKGSWTIMSGLGGNLADPMDPKTTFRGMAGETYVLRWIIRNECGLTQDDVILSIKPPCRPMPSQANAGEDHIGVDQCRLKAEQPESGRGKWTVVSGPEGKFANKDTNLTAFMGKPGESYRLRWTVSTACGSTFDEISVTFNTYCPEEFTDFRDGNKYKGIRIAGQCWMAQNLNYKAEGIASYCYDGYQDYCDKYGSLYTWQTVMQGENREHSRGICPEGWHVPGDMDWQKIIDSSGFTGIELQENGKSDFDIPMGGARYTNGKFLNVREYAYFWTSTSKDEKTAWNRYFPSKSNSVDHFPTDKNHGFSLRCIKDDK